MPRRPKKGKDLGKIRIIPLGGLGEIGKNMTVIEYENDMVIVDCGLGFAGHRSGHPRFFLSRIQP